MNASTRGIGMTSQRTRDRLVERLRAGGIRNEAVLEVIRSTPRHLFVDEALASRAYEDTALPIGHNQTISQPYIVAAMTDLIVSTSPQKVLEIGTGSGYQTAVLAALVPKIYTVERIEPLARQARQRNFLQLHAVLGPVNRLCIDAAGIDGPMVYPFVADDPSLRQRLIAQKVYVATYWQEVMQREQASALEKALVEQLVALPIDQRYGPEEMQFVLDLIEGRSPPRQ